MDAKRRVAEAAALRFLRDGGDPAVPFSLDPDEYVAWQGMAHWDFVANALSGAGFDPARAEEVIAEAIEWANELEHAANEVALKGGGDLGELAAAGAYHDALPPRPGAREARRLPPASAAGPRTARPIEPQNPGVAPLRLACRTRRRRT
jgi:hypothetical protein